MILFPFEGYEKFAEGISNPNVFLGSFRIKQYKSGESRAYLDSMIIGEDCIIIGSISPPAENFLNTAKLAEVIKSNGAKSVTLFCPYLAYTRHDNAIPSEGSTFHLICAMLKASGVGRLISVDPHGSVAYGLSYGFPVTSLDSSLLLATEIIQSIASDAPAMIVSPDKEYKNNAKSISDTLGLPLLVLEKVREGDNVTILPFEKAITKHVIIVDDILDTGNTMIAAVKALMLGGASKVTIAVSHGLFTKDNSDILFKLGVNKIITTDSTKEAVAMANIDPRVHIVSLVRLFQGILPQ